MNSGILLSASDTAKPPEPDETWRPVPGHEGWYSVSNLGRVWAEDRTVTRGGARPGPMRWRGRILVPGTHHTGGYQLVNLCRNGRRVTRQVHVLVLTAFVGPRPKGQQGCHWDGNPTNNRLDNLRWATAGDNQRDNVRLGTHAFASRERCPRDHLLVEPNLVRCLARRGYRDCLACNRARTTRHNWRKRHGVDIDWVPLAHANYAEIMAEVAA